MTILELPSGPEIFLCEMELYQGKVSVVIGFQTISCRSNGHDNSILWYIQYK